MIKVLVNGALGRMGRTVCNAVSADSELELVGAVDILEGEVEGVQVETNLDAALKKYSPEVMVDFTRPNVVFDNVMTALENKVSPVVGTTGLSDEAKEKIRELAEKNNTPAFIAPNFALGAVLMMLTAQKIAKYMPDVEIIELHHDKKLDAPSGTAELTAKMIAEVRPSHKQGHLDEVERLANVRGADFDGIRIHSVRLPGYVAHQEVIFGGLGQTLTIRHDSTGRDSFMPGVVLACKKVRNLRGLTIGLDKILD
ncbi:MAG: 4-hydroxy-tetrahydrodipicolinate reductase [Selenomonadaceae bacterium]|nr:4-hydroxy-tetrahydrodipicolinate reductase [Selenomonadaceae bacterium]